MGDALVTSATITLKDHGGGVLGSAPMASWQLPAGNFVPAKLTGRIISPRPDAETDLNSDLAYYRRNHSGMTYRVRICVKGMAWPLKYTLTTAPSGATIGSELDRSIDGVTGLTLHTWGTDYAVVEWTSPASGTETFTVQVDDQEGNVETVTWTTTQEDTAFVVVDQDAAPSGVGTLADPLKEFAADLWKNSDADTTFAGKTAVFRASTADYVINAGSVNTSPQLDNAKKPSCYMAFPGEAPVFDQSGGHWRNNTGSPGSSEDLSVIDIICDGARTDLANNRIFNMLNPDDRHVFWGVTFSNTTEGTSGTDNPACIFHGGNTADRVDLVVVDCFAASTVDVPIWNGFDSDGVLVEHNDLQSLPSSVGLLVKDSTSNISVRANNFDGGFDEAAINMFNQISDSKPQIQNQEVCWNKIQSTASLGVNGAITWNKQTGTANVANANEYRNTIVETLAHANRYFNPSEPASEPTDRIGNALFGSNGYINGTDFTTDSPDTNEELFANDFDANGDLQDGGTSVAARTDLLGTVSSEVAG